MKSFAVLALVSLATVARAQLPSSAPTCVSFCFGVKLTEVGTLAPGIASTDLAGLCASHNFIQAFANCLSDNCPSRANVATGIMLGQQVCASAGAAIVSTGLTGGVTAFTAQLSSIPIASGAAASGAESAASGAIASGAVSASGAAASGATGASGVSGVAGASSPLSGASVVSSGASGAAFTGASGASGAASTAVSGASGVASTAVAGAGGAASSGVSGATGAASTVTSGAVAGATAAASGAQSVASAATSAVKSGAGSLQMGAGLLVASFIGAVAVVAL